MPWPPAPSGALRAGISTPSRWRSTRRANSAATPISTAATPQAYSRAIVAYGKQLNVMWVYVVARLSGAAPGTRLRVRDSPPTRRESCPRRRQARGGDARRGPRRRRCVDITPDPLLGRPEASNARETEQRLVIALAFRPSLSWPLVWRRGKVPLGQRAGDRLRADTIVWARRCVRCPRRPKL